MTSVYLNSSLYIEQDVPWEFSQQLSAQVQVLCVTGWCVQWFVPLLCAGALVCTWWELGFSRKKPVKAV